MTIGLPVDRCGVDVTFWVSESIERGVGLTAGKCGVVVDVCVSSVDSTEGGVINTPLSSINKADIFFMGLRAAT